MSLLGAEYASSDDDSPSNLIFSSTKDRPSIAVEPAPKIGLADPMQIHSALAKPTDTALTYNPRYEDLALEFQGPSNPFNIKQANAIGKKNIPTGFARETNMSDASFTTQQRTYQARGYALEPNASGRFIGDLTSVEAFDGKDIVQLRGTGAKRKRENRGDASIVDGDGRYLGPWAKPVNELQYEQRTASAGDDSELASDEEYVEEEEEDEGASSAAAQAALVKTPMDKASTAYQADLTNAETSEYHGASETDYLGRSYMMHAPNKPTEIEQCFHPKKLIHTWQHGTKAITSLQFLPTTAHLLLSASADAKIKIHDVDRDRELLRTYSGHTKAITATDFSPLGTQFLSGSLDRYMKLWDVEHGTCITRLHTGAIPHVVRFNPSQPHEFLAGMSDKKIVQFDTRVSPGAENSLVQEYDHHLGPVNTITFVDENRRFITTSDDKSLRAWEINIPVPIKFIAEPYMYAMTRAVVHPSGKHALFQSGDNQIVVYAAGDRFRQNRKKGFRGHNTSGYAVDVDVSPDGGMVVSGDSGGYFCVWDWKTCKMYHKIKACGDGAITCVRWNQQTTSRVATGGTDGLIKYWD